MPDSPMGQSGDSQPKVSGPVCSPVYRCFPPQPTICLICGNTAADQCPWRKDEDDA